MPSLKWNDADELGYQLSSNHPELDPMTVSFPLMHKWITELPEFADDPAASTEAVLESIQMAWVGYWRDSQRG